VFNPASQISGDSSEMTECLQLTSGKKIIRKVKKGAASSGGSKNEISAFAFGSATGPAMTGSATTATKTGHLKTNINLVQPGGGFSSANLVSSRVMAGNSHSAGAASMKSQTLKNYSSTQSLTKAGLNNIRLKQLVQL